jgi:16S rRNA (cytidine1402-2'-O)-methyltransferase
LRGRADEILGKIAGREVKGEITLLIGKGEAAGQAAASKKKSAKARLSEIANEEQLDEKAALKRLAKELGVSKSEAYRRVQQS